MHTKVDPIHFPWPQTVIEKSFPSIPINPLLYVLVVQTTSADQKPKNIARTRLISNRHDRSLSNFARPLCKSCHPHSTAANRGGCIVTPVQTRTQSITRCFFSRELIKLENCTEKDANRILIMNC